jgi:hypothetical protein
MITPGRERPGETIAQPEWGGKSVVAGRYGRYKAGEWDDTVPVLVQLRDVSIAFKALGRLQRLASHADWARLIGIGGEYSTLTQWLRQRQKKRAGQLGRTRKWAMWRAKVAPDIQGGVPSTQNFIAWFVDPTSAGMTKYGRWRRLPLGQVKGPLRCVPVMQGRSRSRTWRGPVPAQNNGQRSGNTSSVTARMARFRGPPTRV